MKLRRAAFLFVICLAFAGSIYAADGKIYGKGITIAEKTKVSDILSDKDKYLGKTVLVEGKIVDVCEKRGCWIEISSDKEFQSIMFKVNDGEMVFPLEAKGRTVLAEGVFVKHVIPSKETAHPAEHDKGEHKEAKKEGKKCTKAEQIENHKKDGKCAETARPCAKEAKTVFRLNGIGAKII